MTGTNNDPTGNPMENGAPGVRRERKRDFAGGCHCTEVQPLMSNHIITESRSSLQTYTDRKRWPPRPIKHVRSLSRRDEEAVHIGPFRGRIKDWQKSMAQALDMQEAERLRDFKRMQGS